MSVELGLVLLGTSKVGKVVIGTVPTVIAKSIILTFCNGR